MTQTEWTIRLAEDGDGPRLGQLHVDAWHEAYTGLVADELLASLDVSERQAAWSSRLPIDLSEPNRTWVAEVGDELVGFAGCCPCRDKDLAPEDCGEISAAYIRAAYYDRGLGYALIGPTLRHLRACGHRVATLWVLQGNERAIRFYERVGFKADGAEKTGHRNGHPIPERRYRMTL